MSGRVSRIAGIVVGLATFALALLISVTASFSRDEAWFLQVVDRVVHGDVLYRDVYYLATPLPVQVTAALAELAGTGILVEKIVAALAFTGEIAWTWLIVRELGIARRHAGLVWLAVFVYAQHYPNPPYRGIGSALMLAAFWTLIRWLHEPTGAPDAGRDRSGRWLIATGVFAALCFSAMPNLGLVTLGSAALVVAVRLRHLATPPARWTGAALLLGGAFAAVIAAVLAPVVWRGNFGLFVDYAFLNKGPYLQSGGVSYWSELAGLLTPEPGGLADTLKKFYRGLHVLLFPLAVAGLFDTWRRTPPERRPAIMAVLLLLAGAVAGAYPRLNRFHLSYAAPALIVALAVSASTWSRWLRLSPATLRAIAATWLVAGFVSTVAAAAGLIRSTHQTWSSLPHLRGVLIDRSYEAETAARAARLVAAARGGDALLLTLDSGIYYLITGLRNPTPFDHVHVMNFGTRGQDQVISAIGTGRITFVCLAPIGGALSPARLEAFVQGSMTRAEDVGACTVYRPATPAAR